LLHCPLGSQARFPEDGVGVGVMLGVGVGVEVGAAVGLDVGDALGVGEAVVVWQEYTVRPSTKEQLNPEQHSLLAGLQTNVSPRHCVVGVGVGVGVEVVGPGELV
jgi:hypothetical protein